MRFAIGASGDDDIGDTSIGREQRAFIAFAAISHLVASASDFAV